MVAHLGPRGNQKMKMLKVRFFYFLLRDLCRACSEVSESGLGIKIGQREAENERDALRKWSANPAAPHPLPDVEGAGRPKLHQPESLL